MRLLLIPLVLAFALPSLAWGAEEAGAAAREARELREAILALPRDDAAVAYARDLRLEGQLVVASAAGFAGGMLVAALGETAAAPPAHSAGPALVGVSLGVALGMAAVGLPPLLDGQRFLTWYATHPPPPTRLAKLKLMRRWRLASLGSRRIAGGIGAGFLGASTAVVAAVWASKDAVGVNGSGSNYDPTDAVVTAGFGLGLAAAVVALVVSDQELRQEKQNPHRLYREPAVAAVFAPAPAVVDGRLGVGLTMGLTGRF